MMQVAHTVGSKFTSRLYQLCNSIYVTWLMPLQDQAMSIYCFMPINWHLDFSWNAVNRYAQKNGHAAILIMKLVINLVYNRAKQLKAPVL